MATCDGLKNVGNTGQCLTGYRTGLILFKEAKTVNIESAELKATWEALADILPTANLNYVQFDKMEQSENEAVEAELLGGRKIIVDEKIGMDMYSIVADECAYNSIYKDNKNGTKVYGFFTTSGGFIEGEISTDKKSIETIEFYLQTTSTKASNEDAGYINLNLQPQNDWEQNKHAVPIDFDFNTLDVVKNMFTVDLAGTASTSVTFDLYYCGRVSNSDAVADNFTLTTAAGASVAIDSASNVGNTYTLASTALAAGDVTVEYDNTTSSDYMWMKETVTIA